MGDFTRSWHENRRKLWLFRFLAIAFCIPPAILSLFAVAFLRENLFPIYVQEPGHELTGHKYLYDSKLGWRNIPNWKATTLGHSLSISSKGLRDREYSYEKNSGTKRILVLGDSYAWGYGVGDSEIFTEVLEAELAGPPRIWQVLNTGVSGWGTDQEYLFLVDEGFRYSPDVVVLAYFHWNDPINNTHSVQYGLPKPLFLNTKLDLAAVPVPKPGDRLWRMYAFVDPIELTVCIIRKMAEECLARHCSLVVMKFGLFLAPDLLATEQQFEERVTQLDNVLYLDLDDEFAAKGLTAEQLLRGNNDGHWNAFGHAQTARILKQFLVDNSVVSHE